MKALKRFLAMFCTAGTLLFLGLDMEPIAPKIMIMITGTMCGIVNAVWYLLEKE